MKNLLTIFMIFALMDSLLSKPAGRYKDSNKMMPIESSGVSGSRKRSIAQVAFNYDEVRMKKVEGPGDHNESFDYADLDAADALLAGEENPAPIDVKSPAELYKKDEDNDEQSEFAQKPKKKFAVANHAKELTEDDFNMYDKEDEGDEQL